MALLERGRERRHDVVVGADHLDDLLVGDDAHGLEDDGRRHVVGQRVLLQVVAALVHRDVCSRLFRVRAARHLPGGNSRNHSICFLSDVNFPRIPTALNGLLDFNFCHSNFIGDFIF